MEDVSNPAHDSSVESSHQSATQADVSPPRGNPFPIVGIGASAGGLDAFSEILRLLPGNTGMAFVLVQHLDPAHESHLTELLASKTSMPVITVSDGMRVEPDHVFVIPPNASMALAGNALHLVQRPPGLHLPIDTFFQSLAAVQGSRAIGVVLSGNASDGSQGVKAIKAECGITFAQHEASARFSGMPRSAIATGAVDFILPTDEIARELSNLGAHPYVVSPRPDGADAETLPAGDGELKRIFSLLRAATKVDFTHYKSTTIRRRISRRMIVQRCPLFSDYIHYIDQHPNELRELYKDLLITVTSFFREPESFNALMTSIRTRMPSVPQGETFRVWVPGCATGEEVYSLAIALIELCQELNVNVPLQLFGTDISDIALARARAGVYPANTMADVSPERLHRFFSKVDAGYQISKSVRECCIFARQDLTTDPPFSNIDVLSCRNLLIYMDTPLQRRVLPVLHYSLKPSGLLMLGTAESPAATPELFTAIDKKHRIYRRNGVPVRLPLDLSTGRENRERALDNPDRRETSDGLDLYRKVERVVQSRYSPDAVLVDAELHILQFRGHTSPYLDPSPGEATLNVLRMAREELVVPIRRAVQTAKDSKISARQTASLQGHDGDRQEVNIDVNPIAGTAPGEMYFLIVFDAASARKRAARWEAEPSADKADDATGDSRRELAETQEFLRTLREDYEAHAEELRAANEEVRSANEELQSANEELGTTKEELQSANEELTTVNEELRNRNQELISINDDLKNLVTAVNIPIVIVDQNSCIRRFTAMAEKLLEVRAPDIGRPISRIRGHVDLPNIEQEIRSVVESLSVLQREIQDDEGRWYRFAVRPYRTADNRIDGAVLTFLDIDALKRGLKAAEQARDYAEGMIETVREPLLVLDSDLRVVRATASFYADFQVSREETLGRFFYDVGNGQWNSSRLRELLRAALFRDQPFQDFELEHDFPHVGMRTMRINGRRIPLLDESRRMVLVAIEDITERREQAEVRYLRLFETAKDAIMIVDPETTAITDVNPFFTEITGFPREDIVGKPFADHPVFRQATRARTLVADCLAGDAVRYNEFPLTTRAGQLVMTEVVANHYRLGSAPVVQMNIRDITDRKRTETVLHDTEHRLSLFVESVRDYALFQIDMEGKIVSWNSGAERLLGYADAEILGQPVSRLFAPEDVASGAADMEMNRARTDARSEDERWHVRKDGSRFFASGVMTLVRDEGGKARAYAKVMRDVTEKKNADEQLRASLREKEVLLKEIHHRVKNNLQVITSLLNIQTAYMKNVEAKGVLDDVRNRVHSIAAIHEMLYESGDLSRIDFQAYLRQIASDLIAFYGVDNGRIRVVTDAEPVKLNIGQAVPCGLIVSELLTNTLKHAFPNDRRGVVEVRLHSEGGACELVVSDDGIGLPPELNPRSSVTMGLQLVHLLTEQLPGNLEIDRSKGTRLTIRFPSPKAR